MNNIMDKLSVSLEKSLAPFAKALGNNRYFSAIRDSLVATTGLTVIGSFCLLIATFPFPQSYKDFMANNVELASTLKIPFNLTVGIISVYVAIGIGYKLSESYKLNKHIGALNALLTFLIMVGGLEGSLGAEGMISAIVAGIFSVEVMRLCLKYNLHIKLPDQVPENIAGSFTALIPCTLSTLLIMIIVHIIGFDINGILSTVLTPIMTAAGDSIITALLYVVLATLMWFCGLHPSILAAILTPAWTVMAAENMEALAAGMPIEHIFCKPFFFAFVFIGGQCGTLMLNFIMLRSKSKTHRDLARLALPAGLFNINEPMLFGLPIVLNPILIIPALIGQIITTFTTWIAFSFGIVAGMGNPNAAIWNLPAPVQAFLATTSWAAVVLVIVNMIIQGIIYIPFYKVVEKQMIEQENA